jgi:excisionase family DNA binding protein
MSLEDTLRQIVREELALVVAQLSQPKGVKAHVSSTELMESLNISRGTLRKMMAEGLPHTRPGKFPRFDVADVERWLRERNGRR